MRSTPFLSILIPSYNSEEFIERTLNSCVNQTTSKENYEVVVVNDGSTDGSFEIIKRMSKEHPIIRVLTQQNKGLAVTRDVLLANVSSKSEWILWLDADDFLSDRYIELFYVWLNSSEGKDKNIVKSNWIMESEKMRKYTFKKMKYKIDDRVMVRVIKRDLFDNYQFSSKFKYAIEDWDFYLKKFESIKQVDCNAPGFDYFYTWNEDSLTRQNIVYRSRIEHALELLSDPILKERMLKYGIIEHYYSHLYMSAKLWFPDLLPKVKSVRFKFKEPLAIKLQKLVVQIGFMNWFIRKQYKVNNN